jgi:hypothetical protein
MVNERGETMNDISLLEQQLNQLGQELRGEGDLGDTVVRRLVSEERTIRPAPRPVRPMRRRRLWQALAAMAACLCVALAISWVSRPATLHARMLAALAKAKTVHATGWMRQIVRKWPLEKPLLGVSPAEKHPAEFWYWADAEGLPCSYERVGPVVTIRRGGDMTEYQQDADLRFELRGGFKKDRVAQFERMADYLAALARPSLTKEELGMRTENGRSLRGLRLSQGNVVEEFWFDIQTDLPARMIRSAKDSGETLLELSFAVDERIPQAIASYEPPPAKHVRGGTGDQKQRAWRDHVADVERQVLAKPLAGRVGIVPRPDGRTFDLQYPLQTPSGRYWVVPLDISNDQKLTPAYLVRFYAAREDEGERRAGTWRLPKELRDEELPRSDLVYEDGVPWQEWVQFALGQFGLEFVDKTEERTIWVAKQDGRPLKDWRQVKPPVPYLVEGGIEKKGVVRPGIGHFLVPVTMKDLFEDFNRMIDSQDFSATKPWIVDETNLPAPPEYDKNAHGTYAEYRKNVIEPKSLVATDAPYFVGDVSLPVAREWYAKEFGITFDDERQSVTVHVIRKKN